MNYKRTLITCYIGFITQAIVANFAPLLFLRFHNEYNIPLGKIALISAVFYITQIVVDILCAAIVDHIGYRKSVVVSQFLAGVGLIGLAVLPNLLSSPFAGILISVVVYAMGSGLIEVLVSPIVEACPFEHKDSVMSLLHSFYCWGHVAVVVLSTAGFRILGMDRWYLLPILWSIVPIGNFLMFTRVPIRMLVEESGRTPAVQLLKSGIFWVFIGLMICAGASEQGMSQWASMFAEEGLGVSKTLGDLLGPCLFAVLMGSSRAFYGKFGEKMNLQKFMLGSGVLCIISYLLAVLMRDPLLALAGCGLCGLSVGIMWPGTFSLAVKRCPGGGTLMFACFALAGDVGCASGPGLVSFVSEHLPEYGLKAGLAAAILFPVILIVLLAASTRRNRDTN